MNIPITIYNDAMRAAIDAATAEDKRLPPENERGFDCGFAWVDIPTPRGGMDEHTKAFVKWCKENGKGSPRGYGKAAWQFWNPAELPTQSISVAYAGAAAFATVLRNSGIREAHAGQRLD